jgi:UrcA family protein
MSRTFASILVGVAILSGVNAGAALQGDVPTTTVRYDDLNLSSSTGVHALYARLTNAAGRVCNTSAGTRELARLQRDRQCAASALARSVQELNHPRLNELYRAKNHGRDPSTRRVVQHN